MKKSNLIALVAALTFCCYSFLFSKKQPLQPETNLDHSTSTLKLKESVAPRPLPDIEAAKAKTEKRKSTTALTTTTEEEKPEKLVLPKFDITKFEQIESKTLEAAPKDDMQVKPEVENIDTLRQRMSYLGEEMLERKYKTSEILKFAEEYTVLGKKVAALEEKSKQKVTLDPLFDYGVKGQEALDEDIFQAATTEKRNQMIFEASNQLGALIKEVHNAPEKLNVPFTKRLSNVTRNIRTACNKAILLIPINSPQRKKLLRTKFDAGNLSFETSQKIFARAGTDHDKLLAGIELLRSTDQLLKSPTSTKFGIASLTSKLKTKLNDLDKAVEPEKREPIKDEIKVRQQQINRLKNLSDIKDSLVATIGDLSARIPTDIQKQISDKNKELALIKDCKKYGYILPAERPKLMELPTEIAELEIKYNAAQNAAREYNKLTIPPATRLQTAKAKLTAMKNKIHRKLIDFRIAWDTRRAAMHNANQSTEIHEEIADNIAKAESLVDNPKELTAAIDQVKVAEEKLTDDQDKKEVSSVVQTFDNLGSVRTEIVAAKAANEEALLEKKVEAPPVAAQ